MSPNDILQYLTTVSLKQFLLDFGHVVLLLLVFLHILLKPAAQGNVKKDKKNDWL